MFINTAPDLRCWTGLENIYRYADQVLILFYPLHAVLIFLPHCTPKIFVKTRPLLVILLPGSFFCSHLHFSTKTIKKDINPSANDKILDMTKSKAFADDQLYVAKMTISLFNSIQNNVGKGEIAGYPHFLLFPWCFPKLSSLTVVKSWDFVVMS